jgi:hypothetical protein
MSRSADWIIEDAIAEETLEAWELFQKRLAEAMSSPRCIATPTPKYKRPSARSVSLRFTQTSGAAIAAAALVRGITVFRTAKIIRICGEFHEPPPRRNLARSRAGCGA